MTVIINTIWGGRVSQIVDRQISKKTGSNKYSVVDDESNKALIVLTKDALVSIAYTGIAAANEAWMDCVIADCLAHRKLVNAIAQPGIPYLARPIHAVMKELAINLNGKLNSDSVARSYDLKISVVGFHLSKRKTPLAWELSRGPIERNENRYFKVVKHQLGKFLRENPNGLWAETLGNPGETIDEGLKALSKTEGMAHNDIEIYLSNLIKTRSFETSTVSGECIAVQLDLRKAKEQVQITFYPTNKAPMLTPWILTPRLVASPTIMSSSNLPKSNCGNYVISGFEDGNTNLSVISRLPIKFAETSSNVISISYKERVEIP